MPDATITLSYDYSQMTWASIQGFVDMPIDAEQNFRTLNL